jgi:hypothetical protein
MLDTNELTPEEKKLFEEISANPYAYIKAQMVNRAAGEVVDEDTLWIACTILAVNKLSAVGMSNSFIEHMLSEIIYHWEIGTDSDGTLRVQQVFWYEDESSTSGGDSDAN